MPGPQEAGDAGLGELERLRLEGRRGGTPCPGGKAAGLCVRLEARALLETSPLQRTWMAAIPATMSRLEIKELTQPESVAPQYW